MKHKTHVDTVLAFRQKYLQDFGLEESDNVFNQYRSYIPSRFYFTGYLTQGFCLGISIWLKRENSEVVAKPQGNLGVTCLIDNVCFWRILAYNAVRS